MKIKTGQIVARLWCEPCCAERYVIVEERETWRCDQCGSPLIPCSKCLMQHCDVCETGSHFEFDEECVGNP
jgi:hypothetical protein